MAEEEIAVLEAIFCGDGEFELLSAASSQSPPTFRIAVTLDQHNHDNSISTGASRTETRQERHNPVTIAVTFTLPSSYPKTVPDVSLSSNALSREACQNLRSDLLKFAKTLDLEPMVMEMIDWLKDHWTEYAIREKTVCDRVCPPEIKDEGLTVTVLHIDHMRSKVKYIKTLVKWAEELRLGGRLLFYSHLILVLLEGPAQGVKEFILRLRTQRVDVDAGGRSCKERMMRVIADQAHPSPQQRHTTFEVAECDSISALEAVFKAADLSTVYRTQLVPEFLLLH